MVGEARQSLGRNEKTTFLIVDAQSVKNRLAPYMIHVTTANISDKAGALAAFRLYKDNLTNVQNVLVDGGYIGEPFATAVYETLGATVEVAKRSELHKFAVIPKRWVVERSFFRRGRHMERRKHPRR